MGRQIRCTDADLKDFHIWMKMYECTEMISVAGQKGELMETIKVKYVRDIKPIVIEEKGDWIDLRSGITVTYTKGQYLHIPLGVAMQLPEGHSALIVPRSSSFKKWGFIQTNSVGVIDNSYCGDNDEWELPIFCFRSGVIYQNDRICQFRIIPNCPVKLETVKLLGNANRSGFGSTGVM